MIIILLSILVSGHAQCLLPASCTPGPAQSSASLYGTGIYRVRLANLDTTTNGAVDGYQDYGCRRQIQLTQNTTYTLRVQTGSQVAENVVAWLDYNQDGSFAASERVLYSLNGQAHVATFTVPAAAVLQQPLRLRIAADYANSPVPTACSTPQYSQVEDYAVRIAPGNPLPVAAFSTLDSVTCSGVVAFRDESRNAPTNWRWSFGDGGNSTQAQPVHTYAAAGTYAVRLRVCNAAGCDSLAKAAYITVRTDGPRPATCAAPTTAYCCQFGITRVRLAGLDYSSMDGRAGYEDFSCAQRAALTTDVPYSLQLTTGPAAHDVRVYLDLNDDGSFGGPGELLYQGLGVQSPTVPLMVASALNPVLGRALRLRLVADYAGSPATGPCGPVAWGQAEDYAVTLTLPTTLPLAGATLRYDQPCGPTRITLLNTSVRAATYAWDFGDGSTSSTAVSPQHTYAIPGVYLVRLIAKNAVGRDTLRLRLAVAASCPSYCPATPRATSQPIYFTRVQVAGIDNVAPRSRAATYYDFTSQVATVVAGQSYPIRAESPPWTFSGNGPWNRVSFFLDANQDGQFGPSEQVSFPFGYSPHVATLSVPANARAGATRLRAVIRDGFAFQYLHPSTCIGTNVGGSVEDYTVVILPPTLPPIAGFLADLPAACNAQVQFRDTSFYAPTAWQWSFGDGSTSTLQHPLHTYAAPGTYPVSLQVKNAYGTHTATRLNYVTVGALAQGPRPATCLPSPLAGTTGGYHGIDSLRIGQVFTYHQARNAVGYRDETCTRPAIALQQGTGYPLRFRDTNPANSYFFAWLDANDNGVLETPDELVFNSLPSLAAYGTVSPGPLTVPATAVPNRPLRLRVMSGSYPQYTAPTRVPSPCNREEEGGQVRDFSVVVAACPLVASTPLPGRAPWQAVPNPSSGRVTILGSFTSATAVEVLDLAGRRVVWVECRPDAQQQLALNLTGLARGVYLLRVTSAPQVQRLLLE